VRVRDGSKDASIVPDPSELVVGRNVGQPLTPHHIGRVPAHGSEQAPNRKKTTSAGARTLEPHDSSEEQLATAILAWIEVTFANEAAANARLAQCAPVMLSLLPDAPSTARGGSGVPSRRSPVRHRSPRGARSCLLERRAGTKGTSGWEAFGDVAGNPARLV
jgi:hypothetical protein